MSVGGVGVGRVAKERPEPGRGIAVPGAVTRQSLSATSRVFDAGTVVLECESTEGGIRGASRIINERAKTARRVLSK
jgi:hypothetical protein